MHGKIWKEWAMDLWFILGYDGRRLYSYQNISDILWEERKKRITKKTIQLWAKAGGWENILLEAKHWGMIKAIMAEKNR